MLLTYSLLIYKKLTQSKHTSCMSPCKPISIAWEMSRKNALQENISTSLWKNEYIGARISSEDNVSVHHRALAESRTK